MWNWSNGLITWGEKWNPTPHVSRLAPVSYLMNRETTTRKHTDVLSYTLVIHRSNCNLPTDMTQAGALTLTIQVNSSSVSEKPGEVKTKEQRVEYLPFAGLYILHTVFIVLTNTMQSVTLPGLVSASETNLHRFSSIPNEKEPSYIFVFPTVLHVEGK